MYENNLITLEPSMNVASTRLSRRRQNNDHNFCNNSFRRNTFPGGIINDKDELGTAPEISIPGVSKLLDPNYNVVKKIIWGAAVIACLTVCFYQIRDRIMLYISAPLSMNVNVTRLRILPFPAVTICPFYPFLYKADISFWKAEYARRYNISYNSDEELRQKVSVFKLLDLQEINATLLWEMGGIDERFITFERLCEFKNKKNCDNEINKRYTLAFLGTCNVFSLSGEIEYDGTYNGMRININTSEVLQEVYWKYSVRLHEKNDVPKHDLYNGMGQVIHPFFETTIIVQLKQFRHVTNSKANPCQETKEYRKCRKQCINSRLLANASCRLPYVNDPNIPLCEDSLSAEIFYNQTETVYSNAHKTCKCIQKCRQNVFSMIQDVVKPRNETVIKILLPDNEVEIVDENEYYTFQSLLSDIGGNLGLFLGFCLLTALQLLEALALKIKKLVIKYFFKRKDNTDLMEVKVERPRRTINNSNIRRGLRQVWY